MGFTWFEDRCSAHFLILTSWLYQLYYGESKSSIIFLFPTPANKLTQSWLFQSRLLTWSKRENIARTWWHCNLLSGGDTQLKTKRIIKIILNAWAKHLAIYIGVFTHCVLKSYSIICWLISQEGLKTYDFFAWI